MNFVFSTARGFSCVHLLFQRCCWCLKWYRIYIIVWWNCDIHIYIYLCSDNWRGRICRLTSSWRSYGWRTWSDGGWQLLHWQERERRALDWPLKLWAHKPWCRHPNIHWRCVLFFLVFNKICIMRVQVPMGLREQDCSSVSWLSNLHDWGKISTRSVTLMRVSAFWKTLLLKVCPSF